MSVVPISLDCSPVIVVPEHQDLPAAPPGAVMAARDLRDGFARYWMWQAIATQDIRLRYRGSILGPFWLTLNTMIMVGAIGLVYSKLFHQNVAQFIPYLATGLVVWQFISAMVTEGCTTIIAAEATIQQVSLPFSVHIYRMVYRNLLILLHNSVLFLVLPLFFTVHVDWRLVLIAPAILLLCVNGVSVGLLLGMWSARFRDIPPIVANFVQVVFLVTPIFWPADALGRWQNFAVLNPLYSALDIVRAPLLGQAAAPYAWTVMLVLTVIGGAGAFALFARFRARIYYWI